MPAPQARRFFTPFFSSIRNERPPRRSVRGSDRPPPRSRSVRGREGTPPSVGRSAETFGHGNYGRKVQSVSYISYVAKGRVRPFRLPHRVPLPDVVSAPTAGQDKLVGRRLSETESAGCSWFRLGLLNHLLGHGGERACERKTRIGVEVSGDPLLARQLSRPRFLGDALCERLGSLVRRVFLFNIISPTTEPHGAVRRL